jgi:hypothetical protein
MSGDFGEVLGIFPLVESSAPNGHCPKNVLPRHLPHDLPPVAVAHPANLT